MAQQLSRYWDAPFTTVLFRMALGRVLYDRGPSEFDRFRFTTKPVAQWETYLPELERLHLQELHAPAASRIWEEDKLRFARRCEEHGLPSIPITGVIPASENGVDTSHVPSVMQLSSCDALQSCFAALHDFDGFAKPLGSGQGYGAFAFSVRAGALVPSRHHTTVQQMYDECTAKKFPGGGYLLQPRVVPHQLLRPFMPGPGLGTVRVFSFLDTTGRVSIPFAGLRIPAAGAECDNQRHDALGAPIDVATGVLGEAIGRTIERPISHPIARHPETGAYFAGSVIPCWAEVRSLVHSAAQAFHLLPALGWDVAITPGGPLLVETNWQFASSFAERLTNRGWADELRTLYTQCASP